MHVEKWLKLHAKVVHQELHISPNVLLGRWISEQICRVIRTDDLGSAVIEETAPEFSDRLHAAEQVFGRHATEADNVVGVDNFDLPIEVFSAIGRLLGRRRAIARGSAAQDVANINIRTLELARLENPVEELAGRTDERFPLTVLVGPGRLAQKHD